MTDSKPSGSRTHSDVRMRGFAERTTVESALSWLDAHAQCLESESVSLAQSAGKGLAQDIVSQTDVPGFSRAMMDGYAVHAADTHGAAPYNPLALAIIGEVLPGNQFSAEVQRGQAVRIMTGAPIPQGADAVLPAEYSEAQSDRVLCHGEVAIGKHVGLVGEDVTRGTCILSAGRRLRPQDLGLLSSIGCQSVRVVRQPRVRIVITGNELLPPGTPPHGNRIGDANGPMHSFKLPATKQQPAHLITRPLAALFGLVTSSWCVSSAASSMGSTTAMTGGPSRTCGSARW